MQNNPDITKVIEKDLQEISSKTISHFKPIRHKSGVYVYSCLFDGTPAIAKYFHNSIDDEREVKNYRMLIKHRIPTIKIFAYGKKTLVMEDISQSEQWRLGEAEDLNDTEITRNLAHWYFTLHENGTAVSELSKLNFEYDKITEENLKTLINKFPEAIELFRFLLAHYNKLRKLLYKPVFTLTYNDFYWTNLIVKKDKQMAMMFDYNMLGKGYRFSDFRNVCWYMSDEAKKAFSDEYNRLYNEKHQHSRTKAEKEEKRIDDVASTLFTLIATFHENENFPNWAEKQKNEVISGSLLFKAKQLLL